MKNLSTHFILGLMSLLIGSHFLMQNNSYSPLHFTTDITPGHLLIALGIILLIYCFGFFFYELSRMNRTDKNQEKSKDEALN
ncbi:hypothetical protein [Enterococcus sp.]|uniref:hypothetical protein n=1 Tax=Enterococcus sp. TaxID=35783 RepID=UPI002FCC5626